MMIHPNRKVEVVNVVIACVSSWLDSSTDEKIADFAMKHFSEEILVNARKVLWNASLNDLPKCMENAIRNGSSKRSAGDGSVPSSQQSET